MLFLQSLCSTTVFPVVLTANSFFADFKFETVLDMITKYCVVGTLIESGPI